APVGGNDRVLQGVGRGQARVGRGGQRDQRPPRHQRRRDGRVAGPIPRARVRPPPHPHAGPTRSRRASRRPGGQQRKTRREGGDGIDTVEVNGGNGAESFTLTPNGTRVRFDRTTPAPFSIDIGTSEKLVLNANGGDDTFTGSNGLAPLISLTIDGGLGNDTL